jgi:hypothetical protein
MSETQDDEHFETLSTILQLTCSDCGEKNSLRATVCSACGASISQKESDPESLSFLHAEGLDGATAAKATSHKIKRLRLALEGIREGQISLGDYREVVGQVLAETNALQEIINLQALRSLEAKFPPEAVDVLRETSDNIDSFAQAVERMMVYDGSNIMIADEGLVMAEAALEDMIATQQEAAELEAEYRDKKDR